MLTDQQLMEIIADWSTWSDTDLRRQIDLPKELYNDLVLVIQGVRRCGKSTLLMQLPKRYNLNPDHCYCCNFEDPRLLEHLDYNLLTRIVKLARKKVPKEAPCYFFLDEIQEVFAWEKWLHLQVERPKQNYFVVTGSNSRLLSGEFATALTGRHMTVELFPFSLVEFQTMFPEQQLDKYLIIGGFPRALVVNKPRKLLQDYFTDIILRDVQKRAKARSSDAIKQVVKMAFDSCGSELSYRKISAITELTVDTVKSYLESAEQAYLIFACQFFAFSEKKRLIRQKKYYPIDPGLRYAVTGSSVARDLGKSLELAVFLKLRQNYEQVYYWHEANKGEVDFVVMQDNDILPYQVTWNEPEARHQLALDNFYQSFPQAKEAIFITKENASNFL